MNIEAKGGSLKNGHTLVDMEEGDFLWLQKGLKGLGFFAKMDIKHLAGILPYMRMVEYQKGHSVCAEGDRGDSFYLIYRGEVEVTKKDWDKPVARLKPGEFFGEMSLLFGRPRSATVTAKRPSRLFRLKADDFKRLLKNNGEVSRTIRRIADERRKELARA